MDLWRLFDRKLVFVRSPEEESRFCVAICFYLRQENQAARIRELHERDGKRMGLLRRIETPTIRVWECVIGRSTEDPKGATERVERDTPRYYICTRSSQVTMTTAAWEPREKSLTSWKTHKMNDDKASISYTCLLVHTKLDTLSDEAIIREIHSQLYWNQRNKLLLCLRPIILSFSQAGNSPLRLSACMCLTFTASGAVH